MIIGLIGGIGSGKTTLTNYIVQNYDFTEYSFAEPLKQIGKIFGFTQEQLYGTQEQKLEIHSKWGISGRTFLQKIGTELFRGKLYDVIPEMKGEDTIWIELFKTKYKQEPKNYIVSDIRFLDEALAIKKLGGILIRLKRTNLEDGNEYNHTSEQQINKIQYDYFIDNDNLSIEESRRCFDSIYKFMRKMLV